MKPSFKLFIFGTCCLLFRPIAAFAQKKSRFVPIDPPDLVTPTPIANDKGLTLDPIVAELPNQIVAQVETALLGPEISYALFTLVLISFLFLAFRKYKPGVFFLILAAAIYALRFYSDILFSSFFYFNALFLGPLLIITIISKLAVGYLERRREERIEDEKDDEEFQKRLKRTRLKQEWVEKKAIMNSPSMKNYNTLKTNVSGVSSAEPGNKPASVGVKLNRSFGSR